MINIFIGTSEDQDDVLAELALWNSLEAHASEPLKIHLMRNREDGIFGKFDNRGWATPFTNLRWAIPEYCNFEGRAIYMDVDQLNLRDISELFYINMEGKPFASRGNRLCVMVFDNKRMKSLLKPISYIKTHPDYGRSIYWNILKKSHHFDPRWNCLDGEGRSIDDIWHLHFTEMRTQPWKPAWLARLHPNMVWRPHERQDLVNLWKSFL